MSPYIATEQDTTKPYADVLHRQELVISTRHSEYRFRVSDPRKGTGLLSGGMLGAWSCRASIVRGGELKVGGRADFVVWTSSRPTRLTTSRITAIQDAAPNDHA